MSRDDPQMKLRLPEPMLARLKSEAEANKRSMNGEILARLSRSLNETRLVDVGNSQTISGHDEELLIQSREAASAAMLIGLHGYLMAGRMLEVSDKEGVLLMLTTMMESLSAAMSSEDTYKSLQELRNTVVHAEASLFNKTKNRFIHYQRYADLITESLRGEVSSDEPTREKAPRGGAGGAE